MKILVTGGAGYIGSFMTKALLDKGHDVIVFDSLERGYRDAVDKRAKFIQGDLKNPATLEALFSGENIDSVMHFAAYTSVEESTKDPQKYYQNNTKGSENLLTAMIETNKIDKFIFSSSAAVYGNPIKVPIPEDHPKNPINPYGKSKLEVEEMLINFQKKKGLSFVSLRYFNAAGGAFDGSMGENHNPETHIIPLAIKAALTNSEFNLYGTDYGTPDGTCIRDYIHVIDLVEAHILALDKLEKEKGGFFYNVGTGKGYSNKEVLNMVKKLSGIDFKVRIAKRRPGDPEVLVSDPAKIIRELGFKPQYSDLETIVKTAFDWHKKSSKLIPTKSG
jgi:UDP-glucose 4-epimerase